MYKSIVAAVRQALSGKTFILGVVGVVIIIFVSSMQETVSAFHSVFRRNELLGSGFHYNFIKKALFSDGMTLTLPILTALPFTSSVADDIKSGFIKEYLPRTTVRGYIAGKITACSISGGLVPVIGVLAACVLAALVFTPMEAAPDACYEATACMAELMESLLLVFFSGALWSMFGMLFAVLTESKYMAYASPFVFYYLLIILYERYFDSLYVFYPKEWLMPSERWMFGSTGVIIFVSEVTVIAALTFGVVAKRRLLHT